MSGYDVELNPLAVVRDNTTYLIGLSLLVVSLVTKTTAYWQGVCFLALYLFYILVVLSMTNSTIRTIVRSKLSKLSSLMRPTSRPMEHVNASQVNLTTEVELVDQATSPIQPTIFVEDYDDPGHVLQQERSPNSVASPPLQSPGFLQVPHNLFDLQLNDSVDGKSRARSFSNFEDANQTSNSRPASVTSAASGSIRSTRSVDYIVRTRHNSKRISLRYRDYTPHSQQARQRSPSMPAHAPSPQPSIFEFQEKEFSLPSESPENNILALRLSDSLQNHTSGLLGAVELWDVVRSCHHSRHSAKLYDVEKGIIEEDLTKNEGSIGNKETNSGSSASQSPALPAQSLFSVPTPTTATNYIPMSFEVADRCPSCYKCVSTNLQEEVGRFVHIDGNEKPKMTSQQRNHLYCYAMLKSHVIPLLKLWRIQSWFARLFLIFNTPLVFVLSLTVPVVSCGDQEENRAAENDRVKSPGLQSHCPFGLFYWIPWRHSLLTAIQLSLLPVTFSVLTQSNSRILMIKIGPFLVYAIPVFILGTYEVQTWLLCLFLGLIIAIACGFLFISGYRPLRVEFERPLSAQTTCLQPDCKYCERFKPIYSWREWFSRFRRLEWWIYSDWLTFLAIPGFIIGLCWVYALSAEIIGVLKALGKTLNVSDGIMGVTVFAFGNSVGDFATNVMIARLGFHSMATGASWAAPLMSMFHFELITRQRKLDLLMSLGVALAFIQPAHPDHSGTIDPPLVLYVSTAALMFVLMCNLLVMGGFFKFKLTRVYGFFLIGLWCVVLVLNVCVEIYRPSV